MEAEKLRIALVTSVIDGREARGTAGVARALLAHILENDAYSYTLIHHEASDDPLYAKYDSILIPHLPAPFDRVLLRESLFWLTAPTFDVVHYLTPRVWPSYLLTRARKVVVTPHDAGVMLPLYKHALPDWIFQFTNRWLHGRMDRIIAVSEYAKKEIADTYHVPAKRIVVIPNALTSHFANEMPAVHLEEYGIQAHYLLCVGRLDPHKNILRLLEAYRDARTKGVSEHLVLLGGRHMPDYSRKVEKAIEEWGLTSHVHIAPFIPDEQLPGIYKSARAVVYPSLHEGFGLPLLEAMSVGTPVTASNTTALPEIAGDAALLFDPTNTSEMTDALVRITQDESLRTSLIERGRKRVTEFSWENSADRLLALYRELSAS